MSPKRRDTAVKEEQKEAFSSSSLTPSRVTSEDQTAVDPPEPVEDFLRNVLHRSSLSRTLSSFEAEWYGSTQRETLESSLLFVPDAPSHRLLLLKEMDSIRTETCRLKREVLEAKEILVRVRRERDFHQLQHQQVTEQKNRLVTDHKRLKDHMETYEPLLRQLEEKHQAALKHRTPQGAPNSSEELEEEQDNKGSKKSISSAEGTSSRHPKDSEFPVCCRLPQQVQVKTGGDETYRSFSLSWSIKAHQLPISCIDFHPQRLMVASASDDRTWRLWALPAGGEKVGQKLLTGEGHSDWLSGCSFHPDGSKLATTSGDMTVRLWDFSRGCCVLMLSGHTQITWGCSFHSCGHFLASCSADRTAKLWDLNSHRCRLTFRRHTASVNSVRFLASSNLLLTCSADKTLAMWDTRLGVCTTTFQGHQSPCNHTTFSPETHAVASCDARGVVHLWDLRKPASPTATLDTGPCGANQVAFSQSGRLLAVASGDGLVKLLEVESCRVSSLIGHKHSVQSVTFDYEGEVLMSAGSDGLINIWS